MQNLFLFLKKTFPILLFLLLEGVAIFLTVQHNKYQNAYWNNSSAQFYSYVFGIRQGIQDYFGLRKINWSLAEENTELRNKLNALANSQVDSLLVTDSSSASIILPYYESSENFEFLLARVIGNSYKQKYNYITLDKGKKDGVEKGMGVVDRKGVVGMTIAVTNNNALVIPLLNIKASLSVRHKNSGGVGMLRWEGKAEDIFAVNHVNKNFEIEIGDTVVTSGYSSFFPPDYPVGTVIEVFNMEASSFKKLDIKSFNRISDADFVYVIHNKNKIELDSLTQLTK